MTNNTKYDLHLIEPTLHDQTGHGYSYNYSLIHGNAHIPVTIQQPLFNLNLWIDQRGKLLFNGLPCTTHPYFSRKFRQLQKLTLYRKLLAQPGIIYVCTAGAVDLAMLHWLHSAKTSRAKVILHFHQFKQTPRKLNLLRKIAKQQDNFIIFAPTTELITIFAEQGFANCKQVPCPTYPREDNATISNETRANHYDHGNNFSNYKNINFKTFNKVLYAGAARADKGFPLVVDFIQYLRKIGNYLPFELQISAPNSGRYDATTNEALRKLLALPTENLTVHKHTLERTAYQNLFTNAVCLLPYVQQSYHNKFSGIALDAFYAGCPIITTKHTWMGNTTERFNAGITIDKITPEQLLLALKVIAENYHQFTENARRAAQILSKEHNPLNTLYSIAEQLYLQKSHQIN